MSVIPSRAIFCRPQGVVLTLGVEVKGGRSSLTMLSSRERLLLRFGVVANGVGRLFSCVRVGVGAMEGNGILVAGGSRGRGAFPTPITLAYIIMNSEFLNHKKCFSQEGKVGGRQGQNSCNHRWPRNRWFLNRWYLYVFKVFVLMADNLFTFSCQPWEYIKSIILNERRTRQTDCHTRKKQFREFLTAVRGILYTRFIYLRLKTTDFWATYVIT